MPEVELTGQLARTATRSGRNGNEADAGARQKHSSDDLHHLIYAKVELPSAGISFCRAIPRFVETAITSIFFHSQTRQLIFNRGCGMFLFLTCHSMQILEVQESCVIAKMTARCAYKSKQTATHPPKIT